MTAATITAARALELKAEAKQVAARERIKHTAALERIARREGFKCWSQLCALAGGREALFEAKYENPTEQMVRSAERRADRLRRYGSQA